MKKVEYFLLRREKKITLKQLSEVCSCSIALLSLWENDKSNMDESKIYEYKKFISEY